MEASGQFHASTALPPGIRAPGIYRIGDLVCPRADLNAVMKKISRHCPSRELNPGRPARRIVCILTAQI
jgi:hypothetical protein